MFVHFPIGLLLTAVALDVLSLIPRTRAIRSAVPVLYVVGALAAAATYLTGQAAADGISVPADAEPILTRHADFALWTLIFFSAYAVARVATAYFVSEPNLLVRSVFAAVAVVGVVLVWETAERGSEMVYVHAVAVQQQQPAPVAPTASEGEQTRALTVEEGGWTFSPASVKALQHDGLRWLRGDPAKFFTESVSDTVQGGIALELNGETLMFIVADTMESVQYTAEIDATDFSGTVSLVHHVQDARTYDYLTLADGSIRLGRVGDGTDQLYDEATTSATGWVSVRATGDGTHFRGYVDDQMIVHGHAEELPAGTVGMRIEGEGTLRIRRLRARVL